MTAMMFKALTENTIPPNVVANCFLKMRLPGQDEEKISKSRGTAIWIDDYLDSFDPDPLRYYLTAIAPESPRATFDFEEFVDRNNNELVAALGNFVHRSATFVHKYFDGRVPATRQRGIYRYQQLHICQQAVASVSASLEAVSSKRD